MAKAISSASWLPAHETNRIFAYTFPLVGKTIYVRQKGTNMRKLKCYQIKGLTVQEVLDEFNERSEEFGIGEHDILSVSAMPPTLGIKPATPKGTTDPKVEVVIVYWANE